MNEETKPSTIGGIDQQRNQYRTIGAKPQQDQPAQETKPQNDITSLPQNSNTAKPQSKTKTEERDKVTYYLDPGQLDKLDDLRIAYKKATGIRLSEQELMRLIVDRLFLDFLL